MMYAESQHGAWQFLITPGITYQGPHYSISVGMLQVSHVDMRSFRYVILLFSA